MILGNGCLDKYVRSYQMFDTIGAIGGTAAYTRLVGVLVGLSRWSGTAKFAAFATAAVPMLLIVRCAYEPKRSTAAITR
jgi:hypothetical protein